MNLFFNMMEQAGLNVKAPEAEANNEANQPQGQYRTNRKERRAMAKQGDGKRWDKKLAQHYGIPKMFVQHARRHGGSTEMILSEMLAQGAIKYKEMPEAQ